MQAVTPLNAFAQARLALAVMAVLSAPVAFAGDDGWFAGLSVGRTEVDIEKVPIVSDWQRNGFATTSITDFEQDNGYKVFTGYQFNQNFAIEGGYFSLGEFGYMAELNPIATTRADARIMGPASGRRAFPPQEYRGAQRRPRPVLAWRRVPLWQEGRSSSGPGTARGRAELDALVSDLRGVDVDTIVVTDRLGAPDYNLSLSQRRAQAVKDYLVESGNIPASKITTRSVNGSNPVTTMAQCGDGLARAALITFLAPDRRVEVEVTGTQAR